MVNEIPKPTILFVHGSWHQPSHFKTCRDVFEAAGYPTLCPLQPSLGKLPPIGLIEDAQCITDELTRLIEEEGKNVIVVAHSYGGLVATQGVEESFAKKLRDSQGKDGGVLHILYICAFLLAKDVSLSGAFTPIFGGGIPPFITVDDRNMCMMTNPSDRFYNDLPPAEQQHWSSQLIESPAPTQITPITHCAYLYHPVTYLFCTNDAALPHEVQQMMVQNISETYKIKIDTRSLDASHSPFLSMPERVLDVVEGLVV